MTETPVEMRLAHAFHVEKTFSARRTVERQFRVRHTPAFGQKCLRFRSADCVPIGILGFAEQIDEHRVRSRRRWRRKAANRKLDHGLAISPGRPAITIVPLVPARLIRLVVKHDVQLVFHRGCLTCSARRPAIPIDTPQQRRGCSRSRSSGRTRCRSTAGRPRGPPCCPRRRSQRQCEWSTWRGCSSPSRCHCSPRHEIDRRAGRR
jgi:hypothetical protein